MSKPSAQTFGWAIRGALAVALGMATSGCSMQGFKDSLGYGKQAPDEYKVVEQAPLSVPPDFHLRPPEPGMARPQEGDIRKLAERILLGVGKEQKPGRERSPGELAFLHRAGAKEADPNIRRIISREIGGPVVESDDFVDDLMFWEGAAKADTEARVVDPVAEAQRLRENADEGRPVTYGATPSIGLEE